MRVPAAAIAWSAVAGQGDFGSWRHLSRRFFTSLVPRAPAPADETWALDHLLDGERRLWRQMSPSDRRHAVGVARETVHRLGPDRARREVVAAALLHDVGKVASSFGTLARAGVTASAMALGRDRIVGWAGDGADLGRPSSTRARAGSYLTHDRVGAAMLRDAGSAAVTVSWAAEHHLPPERWTVDAEVGAALKAADDD